MSGGLEGSSIQLKKINQSQQSDTRPCFEPEEYFMLKTP